MTGNEATAPWSGGAKAGWTAALVVVGGLFGLALYQHAFVFKTADGRQKPLNDFVQEWTSARNYFDGDPIYMPLEASISRHMGRDYRIGVIDVNAHPPASVLVVLPLGKFPYETALRIWNTISLLALAGALIVLFAGGGVGWSAWYLLPVLVLLITSNSLAQQVLQGQLNLILLLLITGAWAAGRGDRWLLAGALIGVAGALKLVPLFLGLYFLCRRKPLGVFGVGLGFFALNGAAAAVFGPESFLAYFRDVTPRVAAEFQDYWPNASINGYFRKLLHGGSGHVIPFAEMPRLAAALTALGSLLVTALAARKTWRAATADQQDAAFAVCLIGMMLVSPITWDHYFLMLLPALCLLWKMSRGRAGRQAVLLAVTLLLLTLRPRWLWDAVIAGDGEIVLRPDQVASVAESWHALTVISYQFYALAALFVVALLTPPRDLGSIQTDRHG